VVRKRKGRSNENKTAKHLSHRMHLRVVPRQKGPRGREFAESKQTSRSGPPLHRPFYTGRRGWWGVLVSFYHPKFSVYTIKDARGKGGGDQKRKKIDWGQHLALLAIWNIIHLAIKSISTRHPHEKTPGWGADRTGNRKDRPCLRRDSFRLTTGMLLMSKSAHRVRTVGRRQGGR